MVTRNGIPLDRHPLKESVQTNIIQTEPYSEYDACIGAGLDVWKWEQGEYPVWFKANVMVWYSFHNMKDAHVQDATSGKKK